MNDQVTPEGGALPSSANAVFEQAKAESVEAEAKATPKESAAESLPAKTDPEPKPKKSGQDIRIDELTRRLRESERRNERYLRAIEERQAEPRQPAPAQTTPKTLQDFNGDERAFRQHVAKETATEAVRTAKELLAQERAAEQAEIRRERFQERELAFAKTVEDYDEVTDPGPKDNARWACSEAMAEVIEESEEGPALKYFLAQNPEEALKLYRMSAPIAARAMTRLEDRLVAERRKAAEKPVSQAPPPPPKLEGADPGNVESDPTKMTDAQFRKWRKKFSS